MQIRPESHGQAQHCDVRPAPGPGGGRRHCAGADTSNADLIVMSTRALTGPARALLGSTADAIVRAAHCPVLLIHRAQAAADVPDEFQSVRTETESVATPT